MSTSHHIPKIQLDKKACRALMINGVVAIALALVACAASTPVFAQSRPAPSATAETIPAPSDTGTAEELREDCERNCTLAKSREQVECDRIAEQCLYNIRFAPALFWLSLRSICNSNHQICMSEATVKWSNCSIDCSTAYIETVKSLLPSSPTNRR